MAGAVGGSLRDGFPPPSRCVSFLVLKAQLELQQSELELSHFDLQQALFLLESDTSESPLWGGGTGRAEVSPEPGLCRR